MAQHVRIVLHGRHASNPDVRAAVGTLRERGTHIDVALTWEAGDATRLAREAAQLGIDRIIAGGGDGTVNEVLRGIVEEDDPPALGILPLGTANDLATALGLPSDDVLAALDVAVQSGPRSVDVGCFDNGQPRYFLNAVTGGFGSEVTSETPEGLKKVLGGLAYMLTGLSNAASIEARPVDLTLRDALRNEDVNWSGDALLIAVCNGRRVGGRPVSEQALLDDGLFDVLLLPSLEDGRWRELLSLARDVGAQAAFEAEQLHWRADQVSLETPRPMQFNLDGEPVATTAAQLRCQPARIGLCAPEDSPLLSEGTP